MQLHHVRHWDCPPRPPTASAPNPSAIGNAFTAGGAAVAIVRCEKQRLAARTQLTLQTDARIGFIDAQPRANVDDQRRSVTKAAKTTAAASLELRLNMIWASIRRISTAMALLILPIRPERS